jgi:energy-coupling factor transporter ATP-binding protein EcfA2
MTDLFHPVLGNARGSSRVPEQELVIPTEVSIKQVFQDILGRSEPVFTVIGNSGSGKTALLTHMACQLHDDYNIGYFDLDHANSDALINMQRTSTPNIFAFRPDDTTVQGLCNAIEAMHSTASTRPWLLCIDSLTSSRVAAVPVRYREALAEFQALALKLGNTKIAVTCALKFPSPFPRVSTSADKGLLKATYTNKDNQYILQGKIGGDGPSYEVA